MQLALEIGMSGGAYLGRAELRNRNHHFNIKHLAKISKILKIFLNNLIVKYLATLCIFSF